MGHHWTSFCLMPTVFAFFIRYLYFQSRKMKIDSIVLIGMAAAMFALPSCKKDKNETSTKEYLKGSLTFTVTSYVTKGEVFDLTPNGVSHPNTGSAKDVGFYWTNSWAEYSADAAQNKRDFNNTAKGPRLKLGANFKLIEFIENKIIKDKYSPAPQRLQKQGKMVMK